MVAGWASKVTDGHWTNWGPEQSGGNLRCPRCQGIGIVQGIKKSDNVGSAVMTKSGMMMDTIVTNGCTHCDVSTTLSRDFDERV